MIFDDLNTYNYLNIERANFQEFYL
jgi:hypothetical protein